MLKIALTGGIGSGKTAVADAFQALGIKVIDADKIAHELTQQNTDAYHQILDHFGSDVLTLENTLDRKKLRDIIFNDQAKKKWLESLLHPLIRKSMKQQTETAESPYCLLVIPLLFEATSIDFIDRTLVVDAPETLQLSRVAERDNTTAAKIKTIIDSQCSPKERLDKADDILINDGTLEDLRIKVSQLHEQYLTLTGQ